LIITQLLVTLQSVLNYLTTLVLEHMLEHLFWGIISFTTQLVLHYVDFAADTVVIVTDKSVAK
jgi:hypothetical protein